MKLQILRIQFWKFAFIRVNSRLKNPWLDCPERMRKPELRGTPGSHSHMDTS